MIHIFTLVALLIPCTIDAVSLCVKKSNNDIQYVITDSQVIIERSSGIGVTSATSVGDINTNLSLQYKSAELRLTDNNTLKLILRNCSNPLTEAAQRLFPRAAEKIAGLLELTSTVTAEEYNTLAKLFEHNTSYANIKKAPFKTQFKFMDLLQVMQTHFPEVVSLIAMPWSTRILYKMKWLFWL